MKISYPAGGWLPAGAHVEWKRDDQGKDFATNWQGVVQAPGIWECISNSHDQPFPNGFGPNYPQVRIFSGPFAGHDWYIGHCTSAVSQGDRGAFGHPLAHADQGHDFAGTTGGWIELGEWPPGPVQGSHWFDPLLFSPMVVNVPAPPLHFGDWGPKVWLVSHRLADLGYMKRATFKFNRDVHGAVEAFKDKHRIPTPKPDGGLVDGRTWVAIKHSHDVFLKTRKKEM